MRALLYDLLIVPMTSAWYAAVLTRVPVGSRLLDVGIGTGGALLAHGPCLHTRHLDVVGIDIDADYIARCTRASARAGLAQKVQAHLQSVYDHRGGPYDAVYFSGSFMLLPDPSAAARHAVSLLAPDGRIYFTQTFEHERSPVLERLKPWLRRLTTIDFGRVTYEDDFHRVLTAAGLAIEERAILHAGRRRSALLLPARAIRG